MSSLKEPSNAKLASALAGELRVQMGKLNRRLREQSHAGDFTASQKSVLIRLERDGPSTVTTLARAEGVKPQSMGATIAALEAAGLIDGSADPADGRQTILTLSDAARELIRSTRAAKEDWLFRALQRELSRAEQQELTAAVELLERLADS